MKSRFFMLSLMVLSAACSNVSNPNQGVQVPSGAESNAAAPLASNKIVQTGRSDCDIKGNISRSGDKIYHLPSGQYWSRTQIDTSKGERFFCTAEEARVAGWRASKR